VEDAMVKHFQLLFEVQEAHATEIMVRLDAMQDFLGDQDSLGFWEKWPIYLAAARKRLADSSGTSDFPKDDKVH
jgi:hypothetical protein